MGIEMRSVKTNVLVLLRINLTKDFNVAVLAHPMEFRFRFPFLVGDTDFEWVMMLLHNSGMPMYEIYHSNILHE
jgi:hypothetical protein